MSDTDKGMELALTKIRNKLDELIAKTRKKKTPNARATKGSKKR